MRKVTATKDSFGNPKPMSEPRVEIKFTNFYSPSNAKKIKRGFVPRDMDDKWFIYYEDNVLYCYRSWTNDCIFHVHFKDIDDAIMATKIVATRDGTAYLNMSKVTDKYIVDDIIDYLLLGSPARNPFELY